MKKTIISYFVASLWLCTIHAQNSLQKTAPEATTIEMTSEFKDIPYLKEAFINATPRDRKDGIAVGQLGVDGGDKAMILKLAQDIANNKYGNFDSFLIAHKGKLLFESYYSRGRVDLPHPQASATKAYTTLALGRAIQLGYLSMTDLDKPLISFLKDLNTSKLVEGVDKITLHQALTMRSGIRLSEKQREDIDQNSRRIKGQRHVQAYLENSAPITEESQSFKYQFDPMLVMQALDAVVPGTAKDFIKTQLLDKMGISNYHWRTDVNGLPRSGNGSSMTSRDMMKWGILTMNRGKWEGEQLVPAVFVDKAINRIVKHSTDENFADYDNISNTGYGYYWWQSDMKCGNKNYFSTSARGGSGQTIILVEELDLVVVTTTHRKVDDVISITASRVLPAFIQNNYPPVEDRYLGQKPPGLVPELFAPEIIKSEFREAEAAFSPDLREFYFRKRGGEYKRNTLFVIQYKNNRWVESQVPPYAGEPFVSLDGKTLYLGNKYRERTATGWSEVKDHDPVFKDIRMMRVTVSSKGTYYFDEASEDGLLRYSKLITGKFEKHKVLPKEINAGEWIAHPYIAPDESYIIWDAERVEGQGDNDLYISFRQKDGSWGNAINLGDKINTEHAEAYGSITPDGKYFFFHRSYGGDKADIYWVDAKVVIEDLRAKQ